MRHYLTIDRGNTFTKVALWRGSHCVKVGDGDDVCTDKGIYHFLNDSGHAGVCKALICSSVENVDDIVTTLKRHGISKCEVLDCNTPIPITNAYYTPETLGPDRLAAAIGAWSKHPDTNLLVIDIGTAITYDIVTAGGCYQGGNIAPGMSMRFDVLNKKTDKLPLLTATGDCPLWGKDTLTAIRSGVINGIVGEIAYYKSQLPPNHKIILTGGDAFIIAERLNFKVEIDPYLVLTGLNSILIYNENK